MALPLTPDPGMRLRRTPHYRLAAAVAAATLFSVATGCGSPGEAHTPDTLSVDTTSAPEQVRWDNYRGVAVPTSASGGPADTSARVPNGYAHTPQGAVIAAIQGQTRLALAPDELWAQTAQVVLAPGPGRDAYAVARVMASITSEADPAQTAQFAGFRFADYSPERATVWLATRMPDRSLSASPTRLVWQGGDWKVQLPDPAPADAAADPAPTDPTPLPALDGYVPFAPAT